MNIREEMTSLIQTHRELFFIKQFFVDFPNAELFFVGGTVRDLLLKRKAPQSDFDFVVRLVHEKDIESWFSLFGEIDSVGRIFGVYKFIPEGFDPSRHHPIDIALPRTEQSQPHSEGGYKEFNIQSNISLPIQEDLARRDFTINAMAINVRTGDLIDPFGGEQDLHARVIRSVGDPQIRFDEDLSRVLRAIRFAAELSCSIETKTQQAIKDNITRLNAFRNTNLKTEYVVPREIIGQELAKALYRNPACAIDWFQKTGITDLFFTHASHQWTQQELDQFPSAQPTLAIALLLHDKQLQAISPMFSLSGLDTLPRGSYLRIEPEDVLWFVKRFQETWNRQTMNELRASTFEKYFLNGRSELLLQGLALLEYRDVVNAAKQRIREIRTHWSIEPHETIPGLLSGNDVLHAGIPAGPRVRETLELLRDKQLDGFILTREQAKSWLNTQSTTSQL